MTVKFTNFDDMNIKLRYSQKILKLSHWYCKIKFSKNLTLPLMENDFSKMCLFLQQK